MSGGATSRSAPRQRCGLGMVGSSLSNNGACLTLTEQLPSASHSLSSDNTLGPTVRMAPPHNLMLCGVDVAAVDLRKGTHRTRSKAARLVSPSLPQLSTEVNAIVTPDMLGRGQHGSVCNSSSCIK